MASTGESAAVAAAVATTETADASSSSAPEQVGPSWRRLSYHRERAQVVGYVRPSIIEDIKEQLQEIGGGVYEEFRDSIFGHFLDFGYDGFSNCNAALHALVAMEVCMPDAPESECWFHVGEQSIRFSQREFAMVSGLRFSGSTFDPNRVVEPPVNGIYRRYWPQGDRVTAKDLRGLFTDGTFRESPADALKVAKVLFAFYMLLCFDGRQTAVERWLWFLIEDTAQWETFPWGKYSFQILIHYLQNLNDVLPPGRHTKGTPARYRPPSYHFYGPTYVLLIWAFEAIPRLGDICATRVSDTRTPRCLRWRFQKTMVDLVDFLFDPGLVSYEMLDPSEEELQQIYMERVDEVVILLGPPRFILKENRFLGSGAGRGRGRGRGTDSMAPTTTIGRGRGRVSETRVPTAATGRGRGKGRGRGREEANSEAPTTTSTIQRPEKRRRIDDPSSHQADGPLDGRTNDLSAGQTDDYPGHHPDDPLARGDTRDDEPLAVGSMLVLLRGVIREEVGLLERRIDDRLSRLESRIDRAVSQLEDHMTRLESLIQRRVLD